MCNPTEKKRRMQIMKKQSPQISKVYSFGLKIWYALSKFIRWSLRKQILL